MKIVLNDNDVKAGLYPFAQVSSVAEIRCGILTIKEKWELVTGAEIFSSLSDFTENTAGKNEKPDLIIDANILPTKAWWQRVQPLFATLGVGAVTLENSEDVKIISRPWQIFQLNDWAIRRDFEFLTAKRTSLPVPASNKIISPENIFIEEGAIVEHSILNASSGPIYISKGAQVMEGCMIRGPFSLGENAVLKMGSKVYGATTIGPGCTGGGEIKNSVLMANSNKAHDGYLGDSVLGEWCNIGGGTSNSNVKNTGGQVKMWDNVAKDFVAVGIKTGLLMGDYSRAGINTSFNTGTVVGVSCNVFERSTPPKHIPNFSWSGEKYQLTKALQDIDNWKKFKGQQITDKEKKILEYLYSQ